MPGAGVEHYIVWVFLFKNTRAYMVSSAYSEAAFATGVTSGEKFAGWREMSEKFDSRVLDIIVR